MAGRGNLSFGAGYHARRRQEGPLLQAAYNQGRRDTWFSIIGTVATLAVTVVIQVQQNKAMAEALKPTRHNDADE